MDVQPFTVSIPQAEVDDLVARLTAARWPNVVDEHAEEKGLSLAWLKGAARHWASAFDWRAAEAELNALPQYSATVRGLALHFLHLRAERGEGLPILLVHGWPDTFLRYRGVVGHLTAAGHDVIVPSLPGFLFSEQPSEPLRLADAAERLHELMTGLGHLRYAVSGGDWGAGIADHLATTHQESVAALHLTDVPFTKTFLIDRSTASEAEQAYLAGADAWFQQAAYFGIQAAEPTALATGLSDSPVALLAWIGAKVRDWSEAEPDLDQLLTEISLHWFTGDARSAMRLYAESFDQNEWSDADWSAEGGEAGEVGEEGGGWDGDGGAGDWNAPSSVPVGLTLFPKDFLTAPRELAERFYDVRRYAVAARGGHFGAVEEPRFFADELINLLAEVR